MRPLWVLVLAWFVACVAYSTVAFANLPRGSWLDDSTPPVAQAQRSPEIALAAAQARPRATCPGCGVVEVIRRFEAVGALPAGYEFTVRLRDGSTRISSDASAAKWRIGDSVMLIGSAKALIK